MRYDIITPFSRPHNFAALKEHLSKFDNIRWIIVAEAKVPALFLPDWIELISCPIPPKSWARAECYWKINWLVYTIPRLVRADRFCFLCDDDAYHKDFFAELDKCNGDMLITSMDRGDVSINNHSCHMLNAVPDNMRVASVGLEQAVFDASLWGSFVFPNFSVADGMQYSFMAKTRPITYVPQSIVLFNYFEVGRYTQCRTLP